MAWEHDFERLVLQSFSFLVPAGFRPAGHSISDEVATVRFGGAYSRIEVWACPVRIDYDVDIWRAHGGESVGLRELEGMQPHPPIPPFVAGIAEAHRDGRQLAGFIAVLAARFETVGLRLALDPTGWPAVAAWRAAQHQQAMAADLSRAAADAFHGRRWADVVRAVTALGPAASALDRKRQAYARRQIGSP